MSRPGPDKPLKKGGTGGLSASADRNAFEARADKPPVPPGRIPNSEFRIRAAFTLIEMMISITIMLILTGLTLAVLNVTMDQDRISDSGRTIQAFMEGARDRAIHAGGPRGVRLLLDSTSQASRPIATSMVYIGSPELYSEGRVWVDGVGNRTLHGVVVPGTSTGTGWVGLSTRNRLATGARIRITAGGINTWYTVVLPSNPLTSETLTLTRDFVGTAPTAAAPAEYLLELTPAVLPNQEPRPLAKGIVIDLNQSKIPSSWDRDILFSPRGTVTGPLAGEGMIHLLLADIADVENDRAIGASTKEGGELILTVTTQTGNISTHHVDITDTTPANGIADDPFRFAELGEAAK